MDRPLVIAHRGASAYETENSLLAFRRALEMRADGIELDVHATVDNQLVVHHDPDVNGKRLARLTLDEARKLRLPNGEPLPTLSEALALITPAAIAFVELKTVPPAADQALLTAFDHAPNPDRCHIHSFDHRIIRRLTQARPGLQAGVLSGSYAVDPAAEVHAAHAKALWQHQDRVDRPLAALLHDDGLKLYVWTVDRPDRMKWMVDQGVDGICSNRPDLARETLG